MGVAGGRGRAEREEGLMEEWATWGGGEGRRRH